MLTSTFYVLISSFCCDCRNRFGQKELFLAQLHLRLANSSIPICTPALLKEGIQCISTGAAGGGMSGGGGDRDTSGMTVST